MHETGVTFGQYIRTKRESSGKSLRSVATAIKMAPTYLSDIEKGKRWPPVKYLEGLVKELGLAGEELNLFYDLVGEIRDGSYPDLTEYIRKTNLARVALRTARDNHIPEKLWQEFIDEINKD